MGTSWVALSIKNIKTRASKEMTSRKNIKIFYFNGVNVAKHWHVAGEVFAISDCLVAYCSRAWDPSNRNKAIRDGKYLARHMPVLGNVHPIKIENGDIFSMTSFLCSLELLYY